MRGHACICIKLFSLCLFATVNLVLTLRRQKKKEEEMAKEKELNELFKVAVSQPKVPVGNCSFFFLPFV